MQLPIELFLGGIGISIALAIFGFIRQPQIPAMLVFGGIFILFIAVTTTEISYGSRIDNIISSESNFNITTSVVEVPNYIYSDLVVSTSGDIDSSPTARAITASPTSVLVGQTIECISAPMAIAGTPASNLGLQVGRLSETGTLILQFGNTLLVSTLTSNFDWKTFCLPDGQAYTIQSGDRLGFVFNQTSTAGNGINVRIDNTNAFDGTNTFRSSYSGSWTDVTTSDHTTLMYFNEQIPNNVQVAGIGGIYSYENDTIEFTELPKVIFGLIGAIFMLTGALMTYRGGIN